MHHGPGVYLVHFATPYQHARHYIGYADDVSRRIKLHNRGKGSRLCAVAHAAGIAMQCVRTWPGADRTFERRLKRRRHASLLCPICNPQRWHNNARLEVAA